MKVAVVLLILIAWGVASVRLHLPPASWFLPSKSAGVEGWDEASTHPPFPDKPPFRFGSRALAGVCDEYGLDTDMVIHDLEGFAIQAKPEWSIKRIAKENDMEPEALFEVIREVALDR